MKGWRPVLAALVVAAAGCAADDCSCGAGGALYVSLSRAESGGSVEVCFADSCGVAEVDAADGVADEAEISFGSLGELEGQLAISVDVQVDVTVLNRDGVAVRTGTVSPVAANNCCGDYWTASL